MKIIVLVIFSLTLAVSSENGFEVSHQLAPYGSEFAASNLYDTIFSEYFDDKPNPSKEFGRKASKPKYSSHRSSSSKNKQPVVKVEKIPEYIGYKENPQDKVEYEKLVGRKGLGFDKRTATSYGLRAPITAKSLEIVGRYEKKEHRDLAIVV